MAEAFEKQILALKGFTFDGKTGRTPADLYHALDALGLVRDTPFLGPTWLKGENRPVVINSYLAPAGKRVHVIWGSDESGLSKVVDVVLDAPSLEKPKSENPCVSCGGMCEEMGDCDG